MDIQVLLWTGIFAGSNGLKLKHLNAGCVSVLLSPDVN